MAEPLKSHGKSYAAKGLVERLLHLGEHPHPRPAQPLAGSQVLREWRADWLCNGRFRRAACRYRELGRIAGRTLVELLVAEPVPAIFDMGSMRKAEQQRLVADLLDELFARNWAPLTIMLDEADAFAPQSPAGDAVRVLSEVDRIARRGRP